MGKVSVGCTIQLNNLYSQLPKQRRNNNTSYRINGIYDHFESSRPNCISINQFQREYPFDMLIIIAFPRNHLPDMIDIRELITIRCSNRQDPFSLGIIQKLTPIIQ